MAPVVDEERSKSNPYGIRAVERVCDIIDALAVAPGGLGLPEIAAACGLPKSSTFRYLTSLEERRWVERSDPSGNYRIGSGLSRLQPGAIGRLTATVHPLLERLRDELNETANLGFLDGDSVAYLDIVESTLGVRLAARPTTRDQLHCTALGKAILATFDEDRARALLPDTLPRSTPHTVGSWEELRLDLQRVRTRGYAVDDEENELGGRCVAVAIPGLEAAVSISAPVSRLSSADVPRVARRLIETVADLG